MQNDGPMVLVVEKDITLNVKYLAYLQTRGYMVRSCRDAYDAITRMGRTRFSLVICDTDLPGVQGRELLHIIKKKFRDTRVIMTSGEQVKAIEYKILGALEVLDRSAGPVTLAKTVKDVLSEKRTSGRVPVKMPVRIGKETPAESLDISADGMLLESGEAFTSGSELELTIVQPATGMATVVPARVTRFSKAKTLHQTAVRFAESAGEMLLSCVPEAALARAW